MNLRGLLAVLAMARLLCAQPIEERAQALLEAKCASCHGAAQMSGLDIRTRDALLRGGKRGPAIHPDRAGDRHVVQRKGAGNTPTAEAQLAAACASLRK